jgi:hypothetical protein
MLEVKKDRAAGARSDPTSAQYVDRMATRAGRSHSGSTIGRRS